MVAAQADGTDHDVILFLSLLTPVAISGIPYDQQTEEENTKLRSQVPQLGV